MAEPGARHKASQAKAFAEAVGRLEKMSPSDVFQLSVKAGIHNPDGSLTREYTADEYRAKVQQAADRFESENAERQMRWV